jgi:AcrR family transcriptional regulator
MSSREVIPNATKQVDILRTRILLAASKLISSDGPDAATTRAIAAAADVQAPAIYRIFGDKRGLLDAATEHGLATYVAEKSAREPHADPVEDLRLGWNVHVSFGLAHPGLFSVMSNVSGSQKPSLAVVAGTQLVQMRVSRIAQAGRLKVSEDRAVALIHSTCVGTVLTLLGQPEGQRDLSLSKAAREAVLAAITAETTSDECHEIAAAVTLRACLDNNDVLSAGEKHLLSELLDRIVNGRP